MMNKNKDEVKLLEESVKNEWYTRGYMPHRDVFGLFQSITFRLVDSLPQDELKNLESELLIMSKTKGSNNASEEKIRRRFIEKHLDLGLGCCAFKHPEMAKIMQETLLLFDEKKYHLVAWCIMPNHVHVLIQPLIGLGKIVQSWKSFTGRWALAHKAELELSVPEENKFWMREYWDRYIRNEDHFLQTIDYFHQNPVKANLIERAEDWAFSSANGFDLKKVMKLFS